MDSFLERAKLTVVEAATAAGQTAIESDSIDMRGYRGALFFTTVGAQTSTAVTSLKVQASSDNGVADGWSDLTGTSIAIADDDDGQTFGVEIIDPEKRYLRAYVSRGTANAVVGEIYALRYDPAYKPQVNTVTDVATFETHVRPAEGTA